MAEYSISGIWTQPLLMHLLGTGELSQPEYSEAVLSLISMHDRHTTMTLTGVLYATEKSGWSFRQPLSQVVTF